MNDIKLKLLPVEKYTGVNHNDPIRFYSWPIIGKLYRKRVEMCLAELHAAGNGSSKSAPAPASRFSTSNRSTGKFTASI